MVHNCLISHVSLGLTTTPQHNRASSWMWRHTGGSSALESLCVAQPQYGYDTEESTGPA